MSQYLHLNETLKGLLCQELIFPQIMTRRNADEFAQKLPPIQVGKHFTAGAIHELR